MAIAVGGVLAGVGVLTSLLWFGMLLQAIAYRKRAVQLIDLPADDAPGGWPGVAVVFAARNEQAEVGRATRSLLAQDYPGLRVIAVDDRSTDATGTILDAIAAEDPRLRVIHVRELPDGWLGKNHALQAGASAAESSATWLLFTDADVVFEPTALRRAVAWAAAEGADHVTAAPEVVTETVGERAYLVMFGLLFLLYSPAWKVEDPSSGAHLGIGAFNLIRTEAFRAIGGFNRLALSVDDDMRIGQALKAAGYKTRVLLGRGALSVRWQVGLRGMIRGVEKNFFAGLDFQLAKSLFGVLFILAIGVGPFAGLFVGPAWTRAICAVGIAAVAGLLHFTTWQSRIGWYYAFALPLSAVLVALSLSRSVWLTLRRRGIRWRDHHYRLEALRAHVRQRNAWTREVWKSTH